MTQVRKPARPPASPRHAAAAPGPVDDAIDPELFRALADPTRARIAACLCKCSRACTVSEIAQCCSVDLSVVSRHLAILQRAGVADATRQGRTVFYRIRYAPLVHAFRALADAIESCRRACGPDDPCCAQDACRTSAGAGPALPATTARPKPTSRSPR